MAQKNSPIINFTNKELKEIISFCNLNELDINDFIKKCFDKGYNIEKYGLIGDDKEMSEPKVIEKIIEKEVIKEVEVPVEKIIEKEIIVSNNEEVNNLSSENSQLKEEIKELKKEKSVLKRKITILEKKSDEPTTNVVEEVKIPDDKLKKLQETISKLIDDVREKDHMISELKKNVVKPKNSNEPIKVQFTSSTNLNS